MEKDSNYSVLESIETYIDTKVKAMSEENRKVTFIGTIIASSILMIAASVASLLILPDIFVLLLGIPSGLGLAAVLFIWLETYKGKMTESKIKNTPKKRLSTVIKGWAILVPSLVLLNIFPMRGVGGAFIIAGFLITLSYIRKTEEEQYYLTNGLVDPREMEEGNE